MSWPSGSKASNQYTDQDTDLISNARADINQTILNVNTIIDNFDIAAPSNGDVMRYDSTSGAWESVNPNTFSQQTLYVPLGVFVENTWSQDALTNANRVKYFRKCLLGGSYWDPFINSGAGDTVAASNVYGSIEGSSIVRSTPTIATPANSSVTGTNISVTLNNGQITYGSGNNLGNRVLTGPDTDGNPPNRSYKYATYTNNYIELPAGNYRISFINDGTEENIPAVNYGGDSLRGLPAFNNMVIYNETADSDLKTITDFADFTNNFHFFTLNATTRLSVYNRNVTVNDFENLDDVLQVQLYSNISSLTAGYLRTNFVAFFGTSVSSTWSPATLGVPTYMGNRYMKIEKL